MTSDSNPARVYLFTRRRLGLNGDDGGLVFTRLEADAAFANLALASQSVRHLADRKLVEITRTFSSRLTAAISYHGREVGPTRMRHHVVQGQQLTMPVRIST